jgi:hypothetical protein
MFNYNQIISMIRQGKNPQQLMLSMMENNMKGTPFGDNLINLARQGNTAEIEKIARNIAQQKGIDFDTEFNAFKQQLGVK